MLAKMQFVNNNHNRQFKEIIDPNWSFYIYGYTNLSNKEIIHSLLHENKFPSSIRGQFALVFIRGKQWWACVDHLGTTNLFYTDEVICPDYYGIPQKGINTNTMIEQQIKILRRHTVGPGTLHNDISRVEPETYVKNGVATKYMNLINNPTEEFNYEVAYDLFVKAASRVDLSNCKICFSGGKDSAWIAMFLKHLGHDPKLIHITSPNVELTWDDEACDLYRKECGWEIEDYVVEYTGEVTDDDFIFTTFWKEKIFPVKSHAMHPHGGFAISGEVSEVQAKAHIISHYVENMRGKINNEHLINYYMYLAYTFNKNTAPEYVHSVTSEMWQKNEGYQYILNYFENIIATSDKPNKYYKFWHKEFCSARMYSESQDMRNEWFNLFTDYDVYNYLMNTTKPPYMGPQVGGQGKPRLFLIGSKMFSTWSDISWRFKSTGMNIPARNLINE